MLQPFLRPTSCLRFSPLHLLLYYVVALVLILYILEPVVYQSIDLCRPFLIIEMLLRALLRPLVRDRVVRLLYYSIMDLCSLIIKSLLESFFVLDLELTDEIPHLLNL